MINVHYFASIREALDLETEEIKLPDSVQTVAALIEHLVSIHDEIWAVALKEKTVLVALNQHMAKLSSPVIDGDEVAFFPPVTGG